MVIPSYWARESSIGWQQGDAIYDHPTPLDKEGTLLRTLDSIRILKDKDFRLVILAVATAEDIEPQVEEKIANIIKSTSAADGVETFLFGPSHLRQIHDLLTSWDRKDDVDLLRLRGYSNIRNLCLFLPHILGSDIAVLIDDDEIFEDPEFIGKTKEFIGRNIGGEKVNAIAGYYMQPDGDYRVKKPLRPWMKCWGQLERMNEAFNKVIGIEPRLKNTPFVFGGNMIIHQNLFTVVPFDPGVHRGEDIDFLMNAKMFGYTFFLDNQLAIKHMPPPKTHPAWMELRQDIYRFIYERAKVNNQTEIKGMTKIYPEELDPYPGCFLKKDLEQKIEKSCRLLSEEYFTQGDSQGGKEALNNIVLAKTDALPKGDIFRSLCQMQKHWENMMQYTGKSDVRPRIQQILHW